MGEYLSPGVSWEERSASAGAVAGVSASTYASVGWLQKGPIDEPRLVTGFESFVNIYGGYWRNSFIPFEMAAFFQNQGTRSYVNRVVPSDAVLAAKASAFASADAAAFFAGRPLAATVDLSVNSFVAVKVDGAAATQVDCVGAVPASTTPTEIAGAIDTALTGVSCAVGDGNRMELTHDTPGAGNSIEFEEATSNDATADILGLDVSGSKTYLYDGLDATDWALAAAWKGAYYNLVRMCLTGNDDFQDGNGGWTRFDVAIQEESSVGAGDWSTLETYEAVVLDDDTSEQFIEDVVNDRTDFCTVTASASYGIPLVLTPKQWLAEWLGEGDAAETSFSGTLRNPEVHEGSIAIAADTISVTDDGEGNLTGTGITSGTINYVTGAWTLVFTVAPAAAVQILATYYGVPSSTEQCSQLTGGTDGTSALTRADVTDPVLEVSKSGLYAFNDLDMILNLNLPDFAGDIPVSNDLIAYGENYKNRFAILTTPLGTTPQNAVKFVRTQAAYNTSYAALYYPWVKIYDPIANDGRTVTIPPGGFVAGAYARTDIQRNVGKAPAGVSEGVMLGSLGLERILSKGERDLIYPARVNPLMFKEQTGRVIWGSRTLSKDAEWLQVNVRRLFMFCEQSIYDASFWVVFENNGPGLWTKMKGQGDGFFRIIFRDGYLKGTKPSEAWFIKIDTENNPPENVDAGLLTADYYIAANKPAEFVRLRFQQKINT